MTGSYSDLLGITLAEQDGRPRATMRFSPGLVGRPDPPRLHGGAIGALLEAVGLATVRAAVGADASLSLLNTSVDYFRGGQSHDTYAEAKIVKLGRRVVNLIATAWQEDRNKPIAQARITILVAHTEKAPPG